MSKTIGQQPDEFLPKEATSLSHSFDSSKKEKENMQAFEGRSKDLTGSLKSPTIRRRKSSFAKLDLRESEQPSSNPKVELDPSESVETTEVKAKEENKPVRSILKKLNSREMNQTESIKDRLPVKRFEESIIVSKVNDREYDGSVQYEARGNGSVRMDVDIDVERGRGGKERMGGGSDDCGDSQYFHRNNTISPESIHFEGMSPKTLNALLQESISDKEIIKKRISDINKKIFTLTSKDCGQSNNTILTNKINSNVIEKNDDAADRKASRINILDENRNDNNKTPHFSKLSPLIRPNKRVVVHPSSRSQVPKLESRGGASRSPEHMIVMRRAPGLEVLSPESRRYTRNDIPNYSYSHNTIESTSQNRRSTYCHIKLRKPRPTASDSISPVVHRHEAFLVNNTTNQTPHHRSISSCRMNDDNMNRTEDGNIIYGRYSRPTQYRLSSLSSGKGHNDRYTTKRLSSSIRHQKSRLHTYTTNECSIIDSYIIV